MIKRALWVVWRIAWSGFLKLLFRKDWYRKSQDFTRIWRMRTLPEKYLRYFYVRSIGNNLAQVRLPDGIMIEPLSDILINDEIYGRKIYDRFHEIQSDDFVIDVGGHVGVFALKASRKAKGGMVISVEPHPSNYELLVRNMKENEIRNVQPLNLALASVGRQHIRLYLSKNPRGHSTSIRVSSKYLRVQAKTIDQLISDLKLKKVDFIKIDAEGAELDILKGAEKTLKENDVFIAASCYHTPQQLLNVCRYLLDKGFRVMHREKIVYAFKRRKV